MRFLFPLFCLLIFLLPLSTFAEEGTDTPLTLLNKPQKNATSLQQPQPAGQPQEIRDIYGPLELTERAGMLLYGGVIALLLLLAVAVFLLLKRRKKSTTPPTPPWEKALSELTEARKLLNPDRALLYMDRVSLILRNYVESRFGIKSTRQTTGEFLSTLGSSSADPSIRSCKTELQTCLEQCDMAKFAHQIPLQENMELMEGAIIGFVEKTRP
ncbi:MAG: hypothetical protein JRC69_05230 [Deltaproteobacteria bacterium]|nr:hypothetical protein [Deltaproteobacteria bacterium]